MLLLVGLGNPGADYSAHRHNVGFMALDAIARAHGFSPWRKKFQGVVADGQLGGIRLLALKPQTYMNLSGGSVRACAAFHNIAPGDVVVFHDELDLPGGRLRIKAGGGHGGHNGVRDIAAHIGPDFRRVRLGIGHPGAREQVTGHVLQGFSKADHAWLDPLLRAIAAHAPMLAEGRDGEFMNRVAIDLRPPEDLEDNPTDPKDKA